VAGHWGALWQGTAFKETRTRTRTRTQTTAAAHSQQYQYQYRYQYHDIAFKDLVYATSSTS
jgi:hypothetical protein